MSRSAICIRDLFVLSKRARLGTDADRRQIFLENARLLAQEIPARIDERISRFGSLPFIVGTHPSIQELTGLYQSSRNQLMPFKTKSIQQFDLETARSFSETLTTLLHNHRNVLDLLSIAVRDCQTAPGNYMSKEEMVSFIEDTVKGRIGVRILAEHHVALQHGPHFGIIDDCVKPAKLLESLVPFCQDLLSKQLGSLDGGSICPVKIDGCLSCHFPYIPAHLDYILFELLKNAFVATYKKAASSISLKKMTHDDVSIRVTIAKSSGGSLNLRIRDQAGGISWDLVEKVFEYTYSTSNNSNSSSSESIFDGFIGQMDVATQTGGVASGYGFGLPVSRLYARFFGGDIKLMSLEGIGCDLFVTLPDLTPDTSTQII